MGIDKLLKSKIIGKKILCIEPGNNLPDFQFSGLNFRTYSDCKEVFSLEDYTKYKDSHFNYIFIHGFKCRNLHNEYNLNSLKELNISCDYFVIDYLGEGYSLYEDLTTVINEIKIKEIFNIKKIKVVAPFEDYTFLKKEFNFIDFFSYKIAGPRVFCSPYNFMLHTGLHTDVHGNVTYIQDYNIDNNSLNLYGGLKWNGSPKSNLYMCLNFNENIHRIILVSKLIKNKLDKHGILSCHFGGDNTKIINFINSDNQILKKKFKVPYINLEKDNQLALDSNFRFGANFNFAKNSYIDVVTETVFGKDIFITEKSMKPFLNLQIPIILGPEKIIQKLRDYGFDMFDDIINHSYDDIITDKNIKDEYYINSLFNNCNIKSQLIIDELNKLKNTNFHEKYKTLKERLLKNQKRVHEIAYENNNLLDDLGKWIFGNSIEIEKTNDKFVKLYY